MGNCCCTAAKTAPTGTAYDRPTQIIKGIVDLEDSSIPNPLPPKEIITKEKYFETAKTGDIVLYYANDDISKVIRKYTDGAYHHVAMVFRGLLPGEENHPEIDPEKKKKEVRVLQATYGEYPVDQNGNYHTVRIHLTTEQ